MFLSFLFSDSSSRPSSAAFAALWKAASKSTVLRLPQNEFGKSYWTFMGSEKAIQQELMK